MEGDKLYATAEGSPQGGVISPVIANVALHGLETAIRAAFTTREGKPTVIRYADDFVVLHAELSAVERAQKTASEWLAGMGLQLKPSKTRIRHTLHEHAGNVGFNFLGFNIRQYPAGKTHSGKSGGKASKPLGFKTIVKPSKEAIRRHSEEIGKIISTHRAAPQEVLIGNLNPIIRGWTSYYSTVSSKRTFSIV